MQDLSFTFDNPSFTFNGLQFAVQIFTFENVYGLHKDQCRVTSDGADFVLECSALTWAGGQEVVPGKFRLQATAEGEGKTIFQMEAEFGKNIRCVKLILHGIAKGKVVNLRETPEKTVPPEGLILRYPEGWRNLYTPLALMKTETGAYQYFRSLDKEVKEKRFALIPQGNSCLVELIYEEAATKVTNRITVPPWEVGKGTSPELVYEEQKSWLAQTFQLTTWEQRTDLPDWAKKIALVASIHGQHWSGYIFNDYAKILRTIQWLAERIEPERILVYLPGWEGRYYWQYGEYRPDPRMGGAAGLKALINGAKELGVRTMLMFGINYVNRFAESFGEWGEPALASTAGGVIGGPSVDWDSSRHYDHGWGAELNPGAPTWQNKLTSAINGLIKEYQFDGVFLDIAAVWKNDPKFPVYEGVLKIAEMIRENNPDVLVAGEGWYDALSAAFPLHQSGHTDGQLHWHDEPYPALFTEFNRSFAHLCLGDPGRGSTGVHELGTNPITETPLRKGIIPTITIVEDTLAKVPAEVEKVIAQAKRYADLFLVQN